MAAKSINVNLSNIMLSLWGMMGYTIIPGTQEAEMREWEVQDQLEL